MNQTDCPRLLIIGLDGLEISYAETLMDSGDMPALAALRDRSARFLLDHGSAQRTGLAWEHAASGLSPADAKRWSAVEFNSKTYQVWQEGARFIPFLERLDAQVIVFDNPYIDLQKTSHIEGIVGWGGHDPGTSLQANPSSLLSEFQTRFGSYPSQEWVYACPAYSVELCQQMGDGLVKALQVRQEATLWLMNERFPNGDIFYVVTGELHSAIEGLWHGVDASHPMHSHPSAPAAAEALRKIHHAVDRFIAHIVAAAGDCQIIAFAMGGMGINHSDLQTMVLLPELLYRYSFEQSLLQIPENWSKNPQKIIPSLSDGENWGKIRSYYPGQLTPHWWSYQMNKLRDKVVPKISIPNISQLTKTNQLGGNQNTNSLSWHPATFYREWWPRMQAFALPSFYDGRIRINLQGRESLGKVPIENHEMICRELIDMVVACRDVRTGKPIIADIERPETGHPWELDSSDADITFVWNSPSNGFLHPKYGMIGPVPYRRTGGHTGSHGVAYFAGTDLSMGFCGATSAFNIAPTIAQLANGSRQDPAFFSGTSLLEQYSVIS